MSYKRINNKPKAIWGTLIQAGLGIGTSLVGAALEKKKIEEQAAINNKRNYDTQVNNTMNNDRILAGQYDYNGNNNIKTYFKMGGRINKRFKDGGKINKGAYKEEIPQETYSEGSIDFMSNVNSDRNITSANVRNNSEDISGQQVVGIVKREMARPYVSPAEERDVPRTEYNTKLQNDPTGDKTYTYQKINGKWFAYNTKTGKSFDISKYKDSVDILEGRKPATRTTPSNTKGNKPNSSNNIAEITATRLPNNANSSKFYGIEPKKVIQNEVPYGGGDEYDTYNRQRSGNRQVQDMQYRRKQKRG